MSVHCSRKVLGARYAAGEPPDEHACQHGVTLERDYTGPDDTENRDAHRKRRQCCDAKFPGGNAVTGHRVDNRPRRARQCTQSGLDSTGKELDVTIDAEQAQNGCVCAFVNEEPEHDADAKAHRSEEGLGNHWESTR